MFSSLARPKPGLNVNRKIRLERTWSISTVSEGNSEWLAYSIKKFWSIGFSMIWSMGRLFNRRINSKGITERIIDINLKRYLIFASFSFGNRQNEPLPSLATWIFIKRTIIHTKRCTDWWCDLLDEFNKVIVNHNLKKLEMKIWYFLC